MIGTAVVGIEKASYVVEGIEALYDKVSKLVNPETVYLEAVSVYRGELPEYGNVSIVIPAMGDGVMFLPLAPQ